MANYLPTINNFTDTLTGNLAYSIYTPTNLPNLIFKLITYAIYWSNSQYNVVISYRHCPNCVNYFTPIQTLCFIVDSIIKYLFTFLLYVNRHIRNQFNHKNAKLNASFNFNLFIILILLCKPFISTLYPLHQYHNPPKLYNSLIKGIILKGNIFNYNIQWNFNFGLKKKSNKSMHALNGNITSKFL